MFCKDDAGKRRNRKSNKYRNDDTVYPELEPIVPTLLEIANSSICQTHIVMAVGCIKIVFKITKTAKHMYKAFRIDRLPQFVVVQGGRNKPGRARIICKVRMNGFHAMIAGALAERNILFRHNKHRLSE